MINPEVKKKLCEDCPNWVCECCPLSFLIEMEKQCDNARLTLVDPITDYINTATKEGQELLTILGDLDARLQQCGVSSCLNETVLR